MVIVESPVSMVTAVALLSAICSAAAAGSFTSEATVVPVRVVLISTTVFSEVEAFILLTMSATCALLIVADALPVLSAAAVTSAETPRCIARNGGVCRRCGAGPA